MILVCLTIERECISGMCLSDIGNFEAFDLMRTIPFQVPQVENMLDILHALDMAVNIDIIILGIYGANQLCII